MADQDKQQTQQNRQDKSQAKRKIVISKKDLAFVAILLALILLSIKWSQSSDKSLKMSVWQDVHQVRADGECADCHGKQSHVTENIDLMNTLAIPAAASHTDQFKRFSHGKSDARAAQNCKACHQQDSCKSCHAILPESHSGDFVEPSGHSDGSLRHALLAKTNISSCASCHQSFVKSCTQCHEQSKAQTWQQQADKQLLHWQSSLKWEPSK